MATGLLAAVVIGVLVSVRVGQDPLAFAWSSSMVLSVALVLAATLVNLARWARPDDELWSCVALLSTLAGLEVVTTVLGTTDATGARTTTWSMIVTLVVLALALGVASAPTAPGRRPPPLAVGVVLGLVAAVALVADPDAVTGAGFLSRTLLSATMLCGFVAIAVLLHRGWPWAEPSRTAMALAALCLGVATSTRVVAHSLEWLGLATDAIELVAAALFAGATYVAFRQDQQASRNHLGQLRERLVAAEAHDRRTRSEQHTIRNLVAGITMAAELLEEDDLEESTRRHFEHRIHAEAAQLCNLFEQRQPEPRGLRAVPAPTQPPPDHPSPDHPSPDHPAQHHHRSRPALLMTGDAHVQQAKP